ncbi:MAG: patatin-like phospholipase family protein [Rickettsiella sp.]|nr:patatin-like phospholipase family protein [Rickettsiella sp.]
METNQEKKIIIEIPRPAITSLIFEGGGVKGLAYAGAFRALKEKTGLLDRLTWVAGSSAGAMTALMVALNYTPDEIERELTAVDFSKFTSPQGGRLGAIYGYITKLKDISSINQGMYDGKELYKWVQKIVEKKLGNVFATFSDLKKARDENEENTSNYTAYKNLLIIVTNADKNKTEIFSWENTPNLQIADAVLASMSIPGYFWTRYIDKDAMREIDWEPTQEKINRSNHKLVPYVDGGVLNNYPIDIFCDRKYWLPEYYGLASSHNYNPSSLGLRVDTKVEVAYISEQHNMALKEGAACELSLWHPKEYIEDKLSSILTFLTSDLNKVEQYIRSTIGIEDCDVKTTDFNLTETSKNALKENGKKAVDVFYNNFLKENVFKRMIYNNFTDLEADHCKIKELIQVINDLNYKDKPFDEFVLPSLKLKSRLISEKRFELTQLNKNTSAQTHFFVSNTSDTVSRSSISDIAKGQNEGAEIKEAQYLHM